VYVPADTMDWLRYWNRAQTQARCEVVMLMSDWPAAPANVPEGIVVGELRQPFGPPPGVLELHATCEKGIVKPPDVSGVDESTESVAVRGALFCDRAWMSMSTLLAGQVGSAGVTLVLVTAVPFPTPVPGTLKLTVLIVALVPPICRISRPPPLPITTVAACTAVLARRASRSVFFIA